MSTLWPDTHPDIERSQIERLHQMPTWRKMALMAEMGQSMRALALAAYDADAAGHEGAVYLTDPMDRVRAIRVPFGGDLTGFHAGGGGFAGLVAWSLVAAGHVQRVF